MATIEYDFSIIFTFLSRQSGIFTRNTDEMKSKSDYLSNKRCETISKALFHRLKNDAITLGTSWARFKRTVGSRRALVKIHSGMDCSWTSNPKILEHESSPALMRCLETPEVAGLKRKQRPWRGLHERKCNHHAGWRNRLGAHLQEEEKPKKDKVTSSSPNARRIVIIFVDKKGRPWWNTSSTCSSDFFMDV